MDGMVTDAEERKSYLGTIYSEGERLSRLINDVLDLTKMESGKLEYFYEEGQINDTLKSTMKTFIPPAAKKNITLKENFPDNLPLIRFDSDRIIQVVTNFLSNAIKFTPEGGTITVHSSLIDSEKASKRLVQVCVEDTGIGIAPEDMSKVFSKFEQIENIEHHSVGTGLGMPICQLIIEEGHGGKIWLESEINAGTKALFTLPA